MNRQGRPVLVNLDGWGLRRLVMEGLRRSKRQSSADLTTSAALGESTARALLATNRQIRQEELQRVAVAALTSMAPVNQPFHAERDRDTFFSVTTAEVSTHPPDLSQLCVLSAERAWDAVLNCAPKLFSKAEEIWGRA